MAHSFSLHQQLIDTFGWKAQVSKAISECGEFLAEAGQLLYLNEVYPEDLKKIEECKKRLISELADVTITCGENVAEWVGQEAVSSEIKKKRKKAFTELENYRQKQGV